MGRARAGKSKGSEAGAAGHIHGAERSGPDRSGDKAGVVGSSAPPSEKRGSVDSGLPSISPVPAPSLPTAAASEGR